MSCGLDTNEQEKITMRTNEYDMIENVTTIKLKMKQQSK